MVCTRAYVAHHIPESIEILSWLHNSENLNVYFPINDVMGFIVFHYEI